MQAGNAVNPLPGVPLVADSLVPNDKNNFAPRVGLAYRVNDSGTLALRGGYGIYYDRVSTRFANTQLFNFPYLALGVGVFRPLSNPFAAVPQPGTFPTAATVPGPLAPLGILISGVYVDPNLRTPYVQQYNANVQWEFAHNYLLEAGYVGSKGTKLLQLLTINQPVYNPSTNTFAAPYAPFVSAQKNATGGLQQVQTSSNSHYDSLQLRVTKRFSRGLQFLSAYTFGKSIHYYSGGTINELVSTPGDQRDWKTNRGRQAAMAFDAEARVGEIRAPTLVITGDADVIVPHENSLNLAAKIPGAKLRVIEGGSHTFFIERPEEFNNAVLEFIRSLDK